MRILKLINQDIILIEHQILVTNLQGNVLQLQGRINYKILGVKGLTDKPSLPFIVLDLKGLNII